MNAPNAPERTALAVAARPQFDLVPSNFQEALQFADYLAASELVPKGYRGRPADCFVAMAWGMEINLKPMQSLNSIATINGKPGIYGDAGKAILLANGCIIEEDDTEIVKAKTRGRCKITRPGRPPVERTFSLEDAKTANLWGKEGPWRNYPWRQMAWRAFWFAARDAASDLLRGMSGAEELMDYSAEPGTAAATAAAATAPATYPQDQFEKNLPAWRKAIEGGKKSADDVIATVETKAPLTQQQEATLREIKAPSVTDVQPKSDAPAVSYAHVADKLHSAKDAEQLATAASLIAAVADETQRKELSELYEQRAGELPN